MQHDPTNLREQRFGCKKSYRLIFPTLPIVPRLSPSQYRVLAASAACVKGTKSQSLSPVNLRFSAKSRSLYAMDRYRIPEKRCTRETRYLSPRIREYAVSSVQTCAFREMRGLIPNATVLRSLRSRTLPLPPNPTKQLARSPAANSFFTTFRLPVRSPAGSRGRLGGARGSGGGHWGGNALLGGQSSQAGGRTAQGGAASWSRSFHSSRIARDVFFVSRSRSHFRNAMEFSLIERACVVVLVVCSRTRVQAGVATRHAGDAHRRADSVEVGVI